MAPRGTRAAWGSLLAGVAAVATLPLAIYLTRFSERYELLHAGFAIPLAAGLALAAVALSGRAAPTLLVRAGGARRHGLARAGRALGVAGLCLAAAAVVSLGVYGLLEYVGSR